MNLRSGITSFACSIPFILVLSTVFAVAPELENGVVSGKYFCFYLAMTLASAVPAGIVLTSSSRKTFRTDVGDGLIVLYGLVTLCNSYALLHSEAATKHILLILLILLYFCFKTLFRSRRQTLYWIVLFFLATGLIESLWGLRQLYGFEYSQHSRFRLTGSFFNPGAILVLPASMSRAAWLAGLGGCSWVAVQRLLKNGKTRTLYRAHKRQCLILLSSLLVLAALGGAGMYHLKKDSADGRLLMWKISLQTFMRHPEGVGIGRFPGSYGHEQAAYFESGKATEQEKYVAGNPEYGFNEYLQAGIEQGAVSLLLFLGMTGYSFYAGVRHRQVGATASLLALLIAALTSYPFSVLPFLVGMSFLLAWIHAGEKREKGLPVSRPAAFGLALCCLFLSLGCLHNRYPVRQAYREWTRHKALYQSGAYESAGSGYASLYPFLSDQLPFLFEYAQCLSKTGHYGKSNEVLEKAGRISCDPMIYNIMGKNHQAMKRYTDAERCFRKAAAIVPNRMYPWYLLTKLYTETGQTEKAGQAARIVLEKEPKVQSTAIREMRKEIQELNIIHTP
jgi:tetratricopeptide (TPR) repeat protein